MPGMHTVACSYIILFGATFVATVPNVGNIFSKGVRFFSNGVSIFPNGGSIFPNGGSIFSNGVSIFQNGGSIFHSTLLSACSYKSSS